MALDDADDRDDARLGDQSIKAIRDQLARLNHLQDGARELIPQTANRPSIQARLRDLDKSVTGTLGTLQGLDWSDAKTVDSLTSWVNSGQVPDDAKWGPLLTAADAQDKLGHIGADIARGPGEKLTWLDNYELGRGVLLDGTIGASPFKELGPIDDVKKGPANIILATKVVADSSSYANMLSNTASASAQYNGRIVSASVSAEASYLRQTAGKSSGVHFVASSSWMAAKPRAFREGYKPLLTEHAKQILRRPNGRVAFERRYGCSYIHGCISGGWYDAVFSFSALDSSEKTDIQAKLSASFQSDFFSGKGADDFKTSAEKLKSSIKREVSVRANGAVPDQQLGLNDMKKIVDNANTFVQSRDGIQLLAVMRPYTTVEDYLDALDDADDRDDARLGDQSIRAIGDQLARLNYLQDGARELISQTANRPDIQDRLRALDKSVTGTLGTLQGLDWSDAKNVDSLNNWVNSGQATDDAKWGPLLTAVDAQKKLNQIAADIVRGPDVTASPVYGGFGGSPFDDLHDVGGAIHPIVSVKVNSGYYINRLIVTYRNDDGTTYNREHGAGSGDEHEDFWLQAGEYITGISGNAVAGDVIDALAIKTNHKRVYGEFGERKEGVGFDIEAPAGQHICAFAGRSGDFLDRIQVFFTEIPTNN